ncbi:Protein PAT1-like 1 [Holothuria leucospilota]|uniref:Protein PAT1-like 1 n=1 Tax=Holothuria leucospilota TaxID=206669 RepID=A0A9Q1BTT3_HOLLE|nr:Protein PAT1-like 1 [Holothuria leucospilota]
MDGYFEFGSAMEPLDEGPEEDDDIFKEKNYNELNDETFGLDEDLGGEGEDWEMTHEKLAFDFDQQRGRPEEDQGVPAKMLGAGNLDDIDKVPLEEDLEKSITQLVLDDEDEDEGMELHSQQKHSSRPINIQSSDSNLKHLFGPGSPPSLFDPNLMSPTSKENIWGAAHAEKAKTKSAEDSLKAILNIGGKTIGGGGGGDMAWTDPSILHAVPSPRPPKVMTLEEIERRMSGESGSGTPQNTKPLPVGTPPRSQAMPIGTPPRSTGQVSPQLSQAVHYWTQKLHQAVGGRVSPSEISNLIVRMHQTSGRISPDYLHQVLIKRASIGAMVNSPNFPQGSRPTIMQRPPHSPFMPMPYPNHGRMPLRPHQGSPMGRGHFLGMSPVGSPPVGRGYPGTPHPGTPHPSSVYGLTPMHPRIPPLRPASDPGPMRRQWNRTPQGRGRPDGRYQHQGRDLYRPTGDEYANLMTQREKDWVIRIQMLQLHTENPMVSDYYYQVMMQRRQSKHKEKEGDKGPEEKSGTADPNENIGRGDAGEKVGKGDGDERSTKIEDEKDKPKSVQQVKLEPKVYKPAQFEGALGRVTSSSVNNPRQLIDVHSLRTEEEEDLSKAKDHGKKRRTLLSIEQMYDLFLKAEDVSIQLNGLPESDTGALLEKRQQLLNDVYKALRIEEETLEQDDHEMLLQIMSIRKGRKLIGRILPLFTPQQGGQIVDLVALYLPTVLKREAADLKKCSMDGISQEETLPFLFHSLADIILCKSMAQVLIMVKNMMEASNVSQPLGTSVTPLAGAIQHKFGISLILCALSRAETLFSSTTAKDLDPAIIQEWAGCVDVFAKEICQLPKSAIAEPLQKYPLSLEHFKHFVSKQSFAELEAKLSLITVGSSVEDNA